MHLRSLPFRGPGKPLLTTAFLFALFAIPATGCGGCDDSAVTCDSQGNNCQICDGYGCHPADPQPSTSSSSGSASSGAGGKSSSSSSSSSGAGGAGGQKPCDPAQATCPCDPMGGCSDGKTCVEGLCIVGCDHSYQCGPGNVCDNGKCVVGCDAQTPCAVHYTCQKGACVPDTKNPQCDATHPCEAGVCSDGICTKACTTNANCKSGQVCDGATGACIPDPSPKTGCDANKPCTGQGQMCGADGYCHYPCNDVNQCKLIDNRFIACDMSICKTAEEVNPECSLAKPCPQGKDCISNKCL